MEFDKSRVYTALNADELKPGDKVIVADDLSTLKEKVKKGEDIETIREIYSEDCQERFDVEIRYTLAYLVERKKNCTNCSHSCKSINSCLRYEPKTEQKAETPELISLGNGQYAERKHCRPFKNTDELIKVWDAKIGTPKWGTDGDLTMPHIWVRRKEANSKGQLITEFGDELHVSMGKEGYNMFDLFLLFTFLDGSVCGVEE